MTARMGQLVCLVAPSVLPLIHCVLDERRVVVREAASRLAGGGHAYACLVCGVAGVHAPEQGARSCGVYASLPTGRGCSDWARSPSRIG